jgi:RNA polymerase primary sigma factor
MTRPRRLRSASVQSPLETYLREINETPLLNADDEKTLAYRIENGDNEARDRMVRANLRLVVNIARGYTGKGLGLQDLIEEGNLGLLRAVQGFDPTMNTRFSTYASYWIKQSIKRALVNTAKTIRIPAYMVELLAKWRRASSKLQDELGRTPTHEEVAKSLNLPKKKLGIIKKAIRVYNSAPQTDQTETGWSLDEMVIACALGWMRRSRKLSRKLGNAWA